MLDTSEDQKQLNKWANQQTQEEAAQNSNSEDLKENEPKGENAEKGNVPDAAGKHPCEGRERKKPGRFRDFVMT